ncbi:MAG: aryl-sulfate sulfotransferase [Vicinamibacterales bacterium]
MSFGVPRVLGGLAVVVGAGVLLQGYPSVYPTGTTIYEPGRTWSGYTVFGTPAEKGAVVVDMNGREVKRWPEVGAVPSPMRVLPGGHLMGGAGRRRPYQESRRLVQADWDGKVVWSFDQGDRVADDKGVESWVARQHHDWQREGSPVGYFAPGALPLLDRGRTLVLAHKNVTVPAITDKRLEDDRLIEVDWQGAVVWDWLASDHVDELGFSPEARTAIRTDPNWNEQRKSSDWLHINAASYLGPNRWYDAGDRRFHPDNVMISSREANIVAIVERASGRIAWRMGPDYRETAALARLGQIVGQHHPHLIPQGLPGAGHLLVFDNGGVAGYGPPNPAAPTGRGSVRRINSRVLELNPVTFEVVWEYQIGGQESVSFFSHYVSSAQRLPNGNTMVTEGWDGRIFELTPEKEIVWEYVSPYFDKDPTLTNRIFRAHRVPYDWIPQLPRPTESRVARPDNTTFRVPGSGDR